MDLNEVCVSLHAFSGHGPPFVVGFVHRSVRPETKAFPMREVGQQDVGKGHYRVSPNLVRWSRRIVLTGTAGTDLKFDSDMYDSTVELRRCGLRSASTALQNHFP